MSLWSESISDILTEKKGDIKMKNALVRLGYSYDIIKEVLADIKQEYGDE